MSNRTSQLEHELGLALPCSDESCVWCKPENIERTRRIESHGRPMIYPRDLEEQ